MCSGPIREHESLVMISLADEECMPTPIDLKSEPSVYIASLIIKSPIEGLNALSDGGYVTHIYYIMQSKCSFPKLKTKCDISFEQEANFLIAKVSKVARTKTA